MRIEYNNILLLPMCGLGDAIHYLPSLHAIRRRYPEARISVVVVSAIGGLILSSNVPDVEIIQFDRGGAQQGWREVVRLLWELRKRRFDVVISGAHPNSPRVSLFAYLCGRKRRIGSSFERLAFLYNCKVDIPTEFHAYDRFRLLLTGIDIHLTAAEYVPTIQLAGSEPLSVSRMWNGAGLGEAGFVLGIASGADTNSRGLWKPSLKRWPVEKYAEVCRHASQTPNLQIAMFGTKAEQPLGDEIAERAGVPIANFCGETTFEELQWMLQKCDAFLSNDTGTLHLAASLGTQVIALFGPTNAMSFAPRGDNARVLEGTATCAPCYPHPTCDRITCLAMIDINAEEVKTTLADILAENRLVTIGAPASTGHPRTVAR